MSEQRRKRSEASRGLHQYLMALYTSYLEEHSAENAKSFVLNIIEEQYAYFSDGKPVSVDITSLLESLAEEANAAIKSSDNEHERMKHQDDLSAIHQVMMRVSKK